MPGPLSSLVTVYPVAPCSSRISALPPYLTAFSTRLAQGAFQRQRPPLDRYPFRPRRDPDGAADVGELRPDLLEEARKVERGARLDLCRFFAREGDRDMDHRLDLVEGLQHLHPLGLVFDELSAEAKPCNRCPQVV